MTVEAGCTQGRIARAIRRHHMHHHCRNEAYWLSFTVPPIDSLFSTAPPPASVAVSALARASHQKRARS